MNNIKLGISQSRGYENVNLELIKVTTNEQGQKLVSGRELHEVLEIGTRFDKWMQRMTDYGFQENIDYVLVAQKRPTNNPKNPYTEVTEYILTLDMAKHIAMVQRTEIGMKVRNYFIECEKVAHNPYANLSPELQMLIKLEQGQTVLTQRVEEQKQDIVGVKQDVQKFKEEMPIFTSQRKEISKRVRALGVKLLGGKKSPAYQDKSLRAQVYSDINGQIHREFGVESCDDIKRRDYSAVFSIIHNYSLPTHLVNTIDYTNSQMSLGV